jgi:hypothetical protein
VQSEQHFDSPEVKFSERSRKQIRAGDAAAGIEITTQRINRAAKIFLTGGDTHRSRLMSRFHPAMA